MRKVLAILMCLCMIAVFAPAFVVSAAGSTSAPDMDALIAGKQPLRVYSGSVGNTAEIPTKGTGAQVNGFGCGFLDGNIFFDNVDAKAQLRGMTDDLINDAVLTFVNGQLCQQAPAHAGFLDAGIGGGWQLGVINAPFEANKEAVVTIVFGNTDYYAQFTVTPNVTTLTYTSSEAVIKNGKATVTVRGGNVAENYSVGDKVNAQLHDDHNDRQFVVKSISGDTIVFQCDHFAPTVRTMLEFNKGSSKGFTLLVDENQHDGFVPAPAAGQKVACSYQKRNGGRDFRFIFSASAAALTGGDFADATVTLTFVKGAATVKTFSRSLSSLPLYRTVIADGERLTAEEGQALFGFIIADVPTFAWSGYELKITKGEEELYATSDQKSLDETVAMGGYIWLGEDNEEDKEQNIHAGNPDDPTAGDRVGKDQNEASWRLFDKTQAKVGIGSGEGNNGTVQFTWEYKSPKTISLYALYIANDTHGDPVRNPKGWTFYGSENGEAFIEIDSVTVGADFPTEGGWGAFYEVDDPKPYQYYKIVFETNSGAYFQLAEMKCFETATEVKYSFSDSISGVTGYSSNPSASNPTNEGLPQFFDGNKDTKFGYYGATNSVTIQWQYSSAVTATGYAITTANDSTRYDRNPNGWKLYGSVDGNAWIELDTVTSSTLFSNEMSIFAIDNPQAFQYYKIEFSVDNHPAFQMADIMLFN